MSADRITDEADLRNGLEESPASRLSRKCSGVKTGSILLSSEEQRSEDIGISELVSDDAGDEMNRYPTGLTFSTDCSGGTLNSPGGSPQSKAGIETAQPKADRKAPLAERNRSFRSESRGRLCCAAPRSQEKNSSLGRICSVVNYWSSDIYDQNESGPSEVNENLRLLALISRRWSVPVRAANTLEGQRLAALL